MSRDHAVGSLVSSDGKGVMLYCALSMGAEPRDVTEKIREVVSNHALEGQVNLGGGPAVSSYIYETTQRDMNLLTPWAVAAIVLILLIAFRDLVGSILALTSTGAAISVAIGLMEVLGEPFNIVLGGMPVILFAVGSAYAIHVLGRYYACLLYTSDAADE